MLKVLIADDEEKVCQLIRRLVDWDALGLEIAAEANDGDSALRLVDQLRPDIVITDIRMPGRSGLELIQQVKLIAPETDVIIISGYHHFDYAYGAIKYGVEDYLLKPLKRQELTETLQRVVSRHDANALEQSRLADLHQQAVQHAQLLQNTFLESVREKRPPHQRQWTPEEVNQHYQTAFTGQYVQLLLFRPDLAPQARGEAVWSLLLQKTVHLVQKALTPYYTVCGSFEDGVCAIAECPAAAGVPEKTLRDIQYDLQSMRDIFMDVVVTIAVSPCTRNLSELPKLYQNAATAIQNRLVEGCGRIVRFDRYAPVPLAARELLTYDVRMRLCKAAELLDMETLDEVLLVLQKFCIQRRDEIDGRFVLDCCKEYVGQLEAEGKKFGLILPAEERASFEERLRWCSSSAECVQTLSAFLKKRLMTWQSQRESQYDSPILLAKQYVQNHYAEPLSLEEMGAALGFNASYFSHLFKSKTGKNFRDYVADVRVDIAIHLLQNTDLSVAEISEQVGYQDKKYFTKVFRKSTGLTPAEYKRLYR